MGAINKPATHRLATEMRDDTVAFCGKENIQKLSHSLHK